MHKLAFDSVIKVFHDFEPNLRRINWIKINDWFVKHKKYTKNINWILWGLI